MDGQDFIHSLSYRKATLDDLPSLIQLLYNDALGENRESLDTQDFSHYISAFQNIDTNPNHYLMVVEREDVLIGMCHLTLIPSLSFKGTTRLLIESVRISKTYRGKGAGTWMIQKALEYAKSNDVFIVQLTTHKTRERARLFYKSLGFQATHEGMKLILN